MDRYICTSVDASNSCLHWEKFSELSFDDLSVLLPSVVFVLVLAFGFKLVRRSIFSK